MKIPGFIRGKANQGNKVAQAFIQQYDNGDDTPYDSEAYAALKAQLQSDEEDFQDYEMDAPREEDFTPEEKKANDRIEELGDKYKSVDNKRLSSKEIDERAELLAEEDFDRIGKYPSDLSIFRKKAKEELLKEKESKNDELTPQQNARFDEKSELIKKYMDMGYANDLAIIHAEKDMVEKDNQDLYEELVDNEYIYGNLDKENIAKVLGERTGKSKEAIESFMEEKYHEGFWDEDMFNDDDVESLSEEKSKKLAPEEVISDWDHPEEDIKYYEKKNNVKLQEVEDGSFLVIPNEKPKQEKSDKLFDDDLDDGISPMEKSLFSYKPKPMTDRDRELVKMALEDLDGDLSEDDYYSKDNIVKRQNKIEDEFTMPENEGWKQSEFGQKSFIKNKDKDNEMFIQYNGADYDGDNQEWVAGYMDNGEYITKKFNNMEDAKEFIDNVELNSNKSQSNWYFNLSDESEHAKAYKDKALKVNPERAALIVKAMEDYVNEKPQRGFITEDQLKRYGEQLGLPNMSDRDLRLMWDDVNNVGGYKSFGTPYDKGGRELEDARSAFAEVVNQEARNRKAKGNYFPYDESDIEEAKGMIRDIAMPYEGYDADSYKGYMTTEDLDKVERIANAYHISDEDLEKISRMFSKYNYPGRGWKGNK